MKTSKNAAIVIGLLAMSISAYAQKQLIIKQDALVMANIKVTWKENGSTRNWSSGKATAAGYEEILDLGEDASGIKVTADTSNIIGNYSYECHKSPGSSGGTFRLSGSAVSVTCNWKADSGSSGEATSKANINEILPGNNTNLHKAIVAKDLRRAKELFSNGFNQMEVANVKGYTPLLEAIQSKDAELVNLVIEKGGDINARNKRGESALVMATNGGNQEIVQALFDAGFDAQTSQKALEVAVRKRNTEIVSLFLANGADANVLLDKAMAANNSEIMDMAIVEGGATPNLAAFKKSMDGRKFSVAEGFLDNELSNIDPNEALTYAVSKNAKSVVAKALEKGGDPQAGLKYAVKVKDQVMMSDAIGMYGADPNAELQNVINSNNPMLLDVLLENNVDKSKALDLTIAKKNTMMINKVIESGATANSSHVASVAAMGDNTLLQKLIDEAQGDANAGIQPAMTAGKYSTAEMLIQAAGSTPSGIVSTAVIKKQKNLLITALENGGDANEGLSSAVNAKQADYVTLLIEKGATAKAVDVSTAAKAGDNAILQLLIEEGQGDANDGMEAAMRAKKWSTVEMLVQAGATADGKVVKAAVANKQKNLLNTAIENGADANAGVEAAVNNNLTDYAQILVDAGAQFSDPAFIIKAIDNKNTPLINLMLDNGISPDAGLAHAITKNDAPVVGLLIEKGANAADDKYIKVAAKNKNLAMVNMLLKAGANPQAGMLDAVTVNEVSIVQALVKAGANAGENALLKASIPNNNVALTKIIVDAGADPTTAVKDAVKSAEKVLEYFISIDVDVTAQDNLTTAVRLGRSRTAGILLDNGCDATFVDGGGNTYLHMGIASGVDMISQFIKFGVDVNDVNNSGDAPLHLAVVLGRDHVNTVKALLDAGAEVNKLNASGKTAFDIYKSRPIKLALKDKGGKKAKKL